MKFEKHLHSVSRAASQRLGILRKSWRVFHERSLLGRCFRGFVLPVLEYCYAVWCSSADTHLKLLGLAVSGARFLTGGVFECDIAHRRSLAVICMLYKIRCNGALPPGPYVPVRATQCNPHWLRCIGTWCLGASVHLSTASLQNLAVQQDFYSSLGVPLERSFWPRIRWYGTGGFQEQGQCFYIGISCSIRTIVFYCFPFLFFLSIGWYCGADVSGLIGCILLSLSTLHCRPFLIIIIINKIGENYITYETKHDNGNLLNSYFVIIGKRISQSMNSGPYDHYQYPKGNYANSLLFAPVSSADVEEIILSLRNKPGNIITFSILFWKE